MVSSGSELVATATASFILGWAFKKFNLFQVLKSIRTLPVNNTKLVLIVRTDLPMTKGKIASQCSHAAVACYKEGLTVCPELVKQWEIRGQPKIVLKTESEENLKSLARRAANAGIVAAVVRDAGRTQVPSGTPTVLGIGPGCVSKIDQITSSLRLF